MTIFFLYTPKVSVESLRASPSHLYGLWKERGIAHRHWKNQQTAHKIAVEYQH